MQWWYFFYIWTKIYKKIKHCDLSGIRSGDKDSIPTDAEQATGLEKKEYDAMVAGIEVSVILCTF